MKYPVEVSTLPYGPEREEAIVRRCAGTAQFASTKPGDIADSIYRAILADFGLEEKE